MPLKQYFAAEDRTLPVERLAAILQDYQTAVLPTLTKLGKYYNGEQAILQKVASDVGKPNHIIIVNYCRQIVSTYQGYLTGNPVSFNGDNIDEIQDILAYNDSDEFCAELLKQALIYGRSFAINYIDADGQQRLAWLDPKECIPVYSADVERRLLYVIRCYQDESEGDLPGQVKYRVEVYGDAETVFYASQPGFNSFDEVGRAPNYFGQCPVTCFSLNAEETGAFAPIITMQDAINDLVSGEVDNFDSFADAYLVLQGVTADEDDLTSMKKHRTILLDGDDHCNAFFLTKNVSDTQVKDILENLNEKLYTIAQCPDFASPQLFGNASSGISLRYKLLNFINAASSIENRMRKALQRIVELMCAILNLSSAEATWRDVEIRFTPNLPTDISETVNIVSALRGVVSDETLLQLLPFVDDPQEELKKVEEQEAKRTDLWAGAFNGVNSDDEGEE